MGGELRVLAAGGQGLPGSPVGLGGFARPSPEQGTWSPSKTLAAASRPTARRGWARGEAGGGSGVWPTALPARPSLPQRAQRSRSRWGGRGQQRGHGPPVLRQVRQARVWAKEGGRCPGGYRCPLPCLRQGTYTDVRAPALSEGPCPPAPPRSPGGQAQCLCGPGGGGSPQPLPGTRAARRCLSERLAPRARLQQARGGIGEGMRQKQLQGLCLPSLPLPLPLPPPGFSGSAA